ncbi:hypothetical protein B296_00035152 [Ensete ventricosum]|uniref:Uncharacterized protein n=1 Tax=Ensete ventricosum TaxID=4639 RepID=A0A426XL38_ENSVE|nr:hypothetical protein B296_00035152 [Ensete ventricosum]
MARDRLRSGIPWTCEVNRPTNWERGSSLPWTNPKREAVVGLGCALARKFNSNSFANRSNEDIEAGLRREYQVLAGPLRVVRKAMWARNGAGLDTGECIKHVVQGHLGAKCSDVLCRIAAAIVRLEGWESEGGRERLALYLGSERGTAFRAFSAISSLDLRTSFWTSDFASELAWESGRLRELLWLGAMVAPPQMESPGLGLQATPFAGIPLGELIVRPRKASAVTTNGAGLDTGERNPGSGQLSIPARRSSRVGSRRDPSDGQVSSVVDFATPLLRGGAWAFIATVMGYLYLNPLSSLLLTIPLHLTMPSVDLTVRRAPAVEGCRPCPPYLC